MKLLKLICGFLNNMRSSINFELEISKLNIDNIEYDTLLEAKQKGFADRQIALC
ncbi:MAG: hypothetical protein CM15mP102_13140 [Flavobacteriales bacterium]|nr:MAG: hypothetical protein CM15mP102_13140 [Flavobacteriales bacterium]